MTVDRLRLFLGKPIKVNDYVYLYSPTVDEIAEIGEFQYQLYLIFATMDKEIICKMMFQSEEIIEEIEDIDTYELLTYHYLIADKIREALEFFVKQEVIYTNNEFYVKVDGFPELFMNKDNYKQITELIREINGVTEKKEKPKFRNKTAEKLYKQMQEMRKKYGKDDTLDLKDICSILCAAEGNGINVFNVGKLTIYQVYEHLERLGIKENHARMLKVWANSFSLKEGSKLPEWMVKTKL